MEHKSSHVRNASLESSSLRNLGIKSSNVNKNVEPVQSLPTSPGIVSIIGSSEEIISSIALSSGPKSGSLSRGSSPASRKKTSSESSDKGSLNNSLRRSPLAPRKVTIANETTSSSTPSGRARFSSNPDDEQPLLDDKDVEVGRAGSVVSNGSGGESGGVDKNNVSIDATDDIDGSSPNNQQKIKEHLERLQQKIKQMTELIKEEQLARDNNVNEYLKLSTNADRQQLTRIKAVFEKKNQKSSANIQQLQKKLEHYQRRKKDIEIYGLPVQYRQPKEVLRDVGYGLKSVGGNIRDGFSGLSNRAALIGKPKEIAHLLKNKFGSADNIKEMGEEDRDEEKNHHGSATLPPNSGLHPTPNSSVAFVSNPQVGSGTTGSGGGGSATGAAGSGGGSAGGGRMGGSEEGSECNSSITSESIPPNQNVGADASPANHGISFDQMPPYLDAMHELQQENGRLRDDIDLIKQTLSMEVSNLKDLIIEERFRCERLEEQVNDLTELHQSEMENLKTNITDMEEKVIYQSEERIRDLTEVFEDCQTRVQRMEHQQAQQQQQFLTLEGIENSNARIVFVKMINVLLTLLQVFLLVVATVAGILTPLLQTKTRLVSTFFVCLLMVFFYLQLSEIRDFWHHLITRFTHSLS